MNDKTSSAKPRRAPPRSLEKANRPIISPLHDDEPLYLTKADKRTYRTCFGSLPEGRVKSVFEWRP